VKIHRFNCTYRLFQICLQSLIFYAHCTLKKLPVKGLQQIVLAFKVLCRGNLGAGKSTFPPNFYLQKYDKLFPRLPVSPKAVLKLIFSQM
jgi:hypothetical protein